MSSQTPPKRLIIFPSLGNNALTITSIMNALHFEKQQQSIKSVLLIYDSSVEKKSNFSHLRKMIRDTKLEFEEQKIPVINDLFSQEMNYVPKDGDCIVVPALPLHLGIIFDRICSEIGSIVGINSIYVCFTKPQGNIIQWFSLTKQDNDGLRIESKEHDLPFKSSIEWYFESVQSHSKPSLIIDDKSLKSIIDSESKTSNLQHWLDEHNILELTEIKSNDDAGFALEKLAAACFVRSRSIHDVSVNVEFGSERKELNARREEDIIAIHNNGNLLYVSCKFAWCKNQERCKSKTLEEVLRLENLQLAFNIPKERVTKILVTTTKARKLVQDCINGVYVTNLAGIEDLIAAMG